MAKSSSDRRFAKKVKALQHAAQDHDQLKARLESLLRAWVKEAKYRAHAFRYDMEGARPLQAFDLVNMAKKYLQSLEPHHAKMAASVLETLSHECAVAVAAASGQSSMYLPQDCTARLRELNVRHRRD